LAWERVRAIENPSGQTGRRIGARSWPAAVQGGPGSPACRMLTPRGRYGLRRLAQKDQGCWIRAHHAWNQTRKWRSSTGGEIARRYTGGVRSELEEEVLQWSPGRLGSTVRLLVDLGRCNGVKSDCGPPAAMKRGGRPTYLRRRSGEKIRCRCGPGSGNTCSVRLRASRRCRCAAWPGLRCGGAAWPRRRGRGGVKFLLRRG